MAGYVAACSAVGRLSSADCGLDHPDGILDVIPGTGTDPHFNPTKIFYSKEVKGSKSSPAAGLDSTMLCTDSQSQPYSSRKRTTIGSPTPLTNQYNWPAPHLPV